MVGIRGVASSVVLAVLAAAPAAHGATPRIVFASDWSTTSQLYAVTPDGRDVKQLTFGAYSCPWPRCGRFRPRPSPDGRRLLFTTGRDEQSRSRLYLADGDGRKVHLVARTPPGRPEIDAEWSPDSRRYAFTIANVLYVGGIGTRPRSTASDVSNFTWSSTGSLAYAAGSSLYVLRGSRLRLVASGSRSPEFVWSPDGTRIAYESERGVEVVASNGKGTDVVADVPFVQTLSWSPSGRFLAYRTSDGLRVQDLRNGTASVVDQDGWVSGWGPRADVLAFRGARGLVALDAGSGEQHVLSGDTPAELTWSPDGRSIAYVARLEPSIVSGTPIWHPLFFEGALKVAGLNGRVTTLISSRGAYAGAESIVWTSPSPHLRYRAATGRSVASITSRVLVAPWPIVNVAADGATVAYQSCNHVFAWTPSTGAVEQDEPVASGSQIGCGPIYEAYRLFDLEIAGRRVVHGASAGNMGQTFWLGGTLVGQPGYFALASGWRSAGSPTIGAVGELAGAGDLLVFGQWSERLDYLAGGFATAVPTHEMIRRVGAEGCPCPVIAEADGPLVPLDVDADRVVVSHEYSLSVHDANGSVALSVPPARAAALSGRDLVVVDGAVLRDYDSDTGAILNEWPLPTASTGRRCSNPGFWCADRGDLTLEDAARGRAAYVYEHKVHVVRLSDGRDIVIGDGTVAAFADDGLAYANGNRLTFVPFAELPD